MPAQVRQALEKEEVRQAPNHSVGTVVSGRAHGLSQGQQLPLVLANHTVQECRPRRVPIFQEKSETRIIFSPETTEFLSFGS